MAIDNENKRRAALYFRSYPVPDGTISATDWRQLVGLYRYTRAASVGGPYDVVTGELHVPGANGAQVYSAGVATRQLHTPGAVTAEVNA